MLNPESKAVYDRNHDLLIRISEVRQAFGLTESDSWDKEIQREFFPKRPPIVRTVFCTIAVLIVAAMIWNSAGVQYKYAREKDTTAAYTQFIVRYEEGQYVDEARERRAELHAIEAWGEIEDELHKHSSALTPFISAQRTLIDNVRHLIRDFPETEKGREAVKVLAELREKLVEKIENIEDADYVCGLFRDSETASEVIPRALGMAMASSQFEDWRAAVSLVEDPKIQGGDSIRRAHVRKLEELEYKIAAAENTKSSISQFLAKYPDSRHETSLLREMSRITLEEQREEFEAAVRSGAEEKIRQYLVTNPSSPFRAEAEEALAELVRRYATFAFVSRVDTEEAYQRYLSLAPANDPNRERAHRRLVDLEVDKILEGDVGELPAPQPTSSFSRSSMASVEVKNDTEYTLTIRYSGPDSQKHSIPKGETIRFSIGKGDYRVAASVNAANVIPYAGRANLKTDGYSASYTIGPSISSGLSIPRYQYVPR
ncbi:MAG: hypothetical protein HRU46_10690 [Verrucomicrobiales bacterium]|nr:hypothetical protein [Verrucomicrobiales bacterium]